VRSRQLQSSWKFFIILMCCAVMLTNVIAPSALTSAHAAKVSSLPPAPKAVTPFTSFNFGDIYTGEVISQIFVIRNEGDAELRILDFKGG
jgi:hypothetical protein